MPGGPIILDIIQDNVMSTIVITLKYILAHAQRSTVMSLQPTL